MWTQGNDNDSELGDTGKVGGRKKRDGYDVNIGLMTFSTKLQWIFNERKKEPERQK